MAYATAQDLIDRYGEDELVHITDRLGSGQIDAAVVSGALADAEAIIDGYLAGRYPLPLASVPPNLVLLACTLARYQLWANRASEEIRQRYEDAIRYLERVASGSILLKMDASGLPDPVQGVSVSSGSSAMSEFVLNG